MSAFQEHRSSTQKSVVAVFLSPPFPLQHKECFQFLMHRPQREDAPNKRERRGVVMMNSFKQMRGLYFAQNIFSALSWKRKSRIHWVMRMFPDTIFRKTHTAFCALIPLHYWKAFCLIYLLKSSLLFSAGFSSTNNMLITLAANIFQQVCNFKWSIMRQWTVVDTAELVWFLMLVHNECKDDFLLL